MACDKSSTVLYVCNLYAFMAQGLPVTLDLRRIYPAIGLAICSCAALVVYSSSVTRQTYFGMEFVKFIAADLMSLNFLSPDLLGAFGHNTFTVVNGAHWTLKIEVMSYVLLPWMIWAMRRFGCLLVLAASVALLVLYFDFTGATEHRSGSAISIEIQRRLAWQLTPFLAAALGYYCLQPFYCQRWRLPLRRKHPLRSNIADFGFSRAVSLCYGHAFYRDGLIFAARSFALKLCGPSLAAEDFEFAALP
jgi:peptidoglycan/LPS O-acetylase OafA/YrhL